MAYIATLIRYVIVYTIALKPTTPQNIVIGGTAGTMPPVLGWAAATNSVTAESLLLFFIIFAWTPPHFRSLALYNRRDYTMAVLGHAYSLYKRADDKYARMTFHYSIVYLFMLFGALLIDHCLEASAL